MSSRTSRSHQKPSSSKAGSSHKTKVTKEKSKGKSSKKSDKKSDKKAQERSGANLQLYCAIYTPHFGNFYHWAFAVFDPASEQWHVFEVVQDVGNGPFRPEHRPVNPQNSIRCRRPLTLLGHMDPGWWDILVQQIGQSRFRERPSRGIAKTMLLRSGG